MSPPSSISFETFPFETLKLPYFEMALNCGETPGRVGGSTRILMAASPVYTFTMVQIA